MGGCSEEIPPQPESALDGHNRTGWAPLSWMDGPKETWRGGGEGISKYVLFAPLHSNSHTYTYTHTHTWWGEGGGARVRMRERERGREGEDVCGVVWWARVYVVDVILPWTEFPPQYRV